MLLVCNAKTGLLSAYGFVVDDGMILDDDVVLLFIVVGKNTSSSSSNDDEEEGEAEAITIWSEEANGECPFLLFTRFAGFG